MVILLELILHNTFAEAGVVLHLVDNFVVDRHSVEPHDKPDYFGLNGLDFLEELEFPNLGDGDAFFRVGDQHALDDFDGVDTDVAGQHVEALNYLLVQLLGCFLLEG